MDAESDGERLDAIVPASRESAIFGAAIHIEPRESLRIETAAATFDDVRQLAVVVWARTKLIDRLLTTEIAPDSRILTGLAEIEAAVAAISERLDHLEDALPPR